MPERHVCSLPNAGAAGTPKEFFSGDEAQIEAFAKSQDGFSRGVYDCVGIFPAGTSRRNKDSVAALPIIICDLDLKDMDHSREEALQVLAGLILPPTEVRDSGNGLHAIWQLKEPLTGDDMARGESAMKRLADLLAGDHAVTHRAALLRRPGTTNTKGGHSKPCHVLAEYSDAKRVYDISEIEEMLELYGSRPLLKYKVAIELAAANADRGGTVETAATVLHDDGPVDVDARLAAMEYQNTQGRGVNRTHCSVIPALIWKAWHPKDICEFVVDATMKMAERKGLKWSRAQEIDAVNKQIMSAYDNLFQNKYDEKTGEIPVWLPGDFHENWVACLAACQRPAITRRNGWMSPAPGRHRRHPSHSVQRLPVGCAEFVGAEVDGKQDHADVVVGYRRHGLAAPALAVRQALSTPSRLCHIGEGRIG